MTIKFTYENRSFTNDVKSVVEYTIHEDQSLDELMEDFKRFLLAAGFQPCSIKEYIPEE